jgi:hypothetical protein
MRQVTNINQERQAEPLNKNVKQNRWRRFRLTHLLDAFDLTSLLDGFSYFMMIIFLVNRFPSTTS